MTVNTKLDQAYTHSKPQSQSQLFNTALLSLRKQKAAKTFAKASYLVRDIWERHLDTVRVIINPKKDQIRILYLGPTLDHTSMHDFETRILDHNPRTKIEYMDPLATPNEFQNLLEGTLEDRSKKFDLVMDTMGFHWINDPVLYLFHIRSLLHAGGFYCCGFLGGTTLQELRHTLIETDMKLFDGAFARCTPMIKPEAATRIIQSAGYSDSVVEHEEVFVEYPTLMSVIQDLRYMGETNALLDRSSPLSSQKQMKTGFHKTYFDTMMKVHKSRTQNLPYHTISDKVTITYDIVYLSGWSN